MEEFKGTMYGAPLTARRGEATVLAVQLLQKERLAVNPVLRAAASQRQLLQLPLILPPNGCHGKPPKMVEDVVPGCPPTRLIAFGGRGFLGRLVGRERTRATP